MADPIEQLAQQIAKQRSNLGTDKYWQGGAKSAFGGITGLDRVMAQDLVSRGITDLSQIGQKDEPVYGSDYSIGGAKAAQDFQSWYDSQGRPAVQPGQTINWNGKQYKYEVQGDSEGGSWPAMFPLKQVDSRKVIINKDTGQPLATQGYQHEAASSYAREDGSYIWSGTYAGDGNTTYNIQFTKDGLPILYTTAQSSSDFNVKDLAPIVAIAAFAVPGIGQAVGSFVAEAAGVSLGATAAGALGTGILTSALTGSVEKGVMSAVGSVVGAGVAQQLGSVAAGIFDSPVGQKFLTSIGSAGARAAVLGQDIGSAVMGAATGELFNLATSQIPGFSDIKDPGTKAAVSAAIQGALATDGDLAAKLSAATANGAAAFGLSQTDIGGTAFKDLSPSQQRGITTAVTSLLAGKPLSEELVKAAVSQVRQDFEKQLKTPDTLTPAQPEDFGYGSTGPRTEADIVDVTKEVSAPTIDTEGGVLTVPATYVPPPEAAPARGRGAPTVDPFAGTYVPPEGQDTVITGANGSTLTIGADGDVKSVTDSSGDVLHDATSDTDVSKDAQDVIDEVLNNPSEILSAQEQAGLDGIVSRMKAAGESDETIAAAIAALKQNPDWRSVLQDAAGIVDIPRVPTEFTDAEGGSEEVVTADDLGNVVTEDSQSPEAIAKTAQLLKDYQDAENLAFAKTKGFDSYDEYIASLAEPSTPTTPTDQGPLSGTTEPTDNKEIVITNDDGSTITLNTDGTVKEVTDAKDDVVYDASTDKSVSDEAKDIIDAGVNKISQPEAGVETGTGAVDSLEGGAGNDTPAATEGSDVVDTGPTGNVVITGDDGSTVTLNPDGEVVAVNNPDGTEPSDAQDVLDTVIANPVTVETLDGGEGNDTLLGEGVDSLIGGETNDTISTDTLEGGEGNDTVSTGIDTLEGGEGNDTVSTEEDTVSGVTDTDVLDDLLLDGTDSLEGGEDNDTIPAIETGTLDDLLVGGEGNATVEGGEGNDSLKGGEESVTGEVGTDVLTGLDPDVLDELITGGEGNATFDEDTLASLIGGDGNDTLEGEDTEVLPTIPTCPEGYVYDYETGACVPEEPVDTIPTCPDGYVFDYEAGACVPEKPVDTVPTCAEGYVYDYELGQCVPETPSTVTPPVVTPPVVQPPAVTPPVVTPPKVTPPVVTPPEVKPQAGSQPMDFLGLLAMLGMMQGQQQQPPPQAPAQQTEEFVPWEKISSPYSEDTEMTTEELLKLLRG